MRILITILTFTIICSQSSGQSNQAGFIDSSVNKIKLRTPGSVENVFGRGKNYVDQVDDETDVITSDGKQLLTMVFHPGGTSNDFYEFRVAYNTKDIRPELRISSNQFLTGKNISLGLTKRQVKKILGRPARIKTENGVTIWTFETSNKDDRYFGRHDFKDGKLIQFWFGEEYP